MAEVRGTTVVDEPKKTKSDREGLPEDEPRTKKGRLPEPISFTMRDIDFFAYLEARTEQDWAHMALYMYRLVPRIVRDPSNIDSIDREKPSEPFTKEYILRNHGSGKYEIKLNDTDLKRTICRCMPDYNEPDFPPKFDLHELDTGFKGNRLLVEKLKREGKLSQDGDVVVSSKSDGADATMADALKSIALEAMRGRKEQPGMENQAFGKMMEMMASASKQSIEIALGQVKRDDPASFIALLSTAKELFAPAKSSEGEGQIHLMLMKMLESSDKRAAQALEDAKEERRRAEEDRKRAHELELAERKHAHELELERLKQKAEAASPVAMVKEVMELQAQIGNLGGSDARNWKEKLVDQGFEALPQVLDAFKGFAYRRGVQQQQPPRPPQQQPAAQATSQPIEQQQHQTAQPQGAEPMPEQPSDPDIAFLLPIFEAQGPRFVQAFTNDPNTGGHHVAADVLMYAGTAIYERIARMGRDKILATIELIPPMKADLAKVGTADMLSDFIDQFITGPDPEDDEDDEEPAIPEGVKPIRKKKGAEA